MLTKTIEQFLDKKKWKYTKLKDSNVFLFGITGKNGTFQCVIDLGESEKEFGVYSICSVNAPNDKIPLVPELLNIFNYYLFAGNFEIDHFDGEIRFRTTMYLYDLELTDTFIEEFIMSNIVIMDKYLPGIIGFTFNDLTINDAIMKVG
jgi:hypothetical protein